MSKKKIRLLIANDASILGTGYAVYGKELLTRLHNTGRYEIAELGCYLNKSHEAIKNCDWTLLPNVPEHDDKENLEKYKQNPMNQFGLWRFNQACAFFKPDIVFDIRDYWMYSYQETSPYREYFSWVVMPTVDSAPQKEDWLHTFKNMDLVVPYTQWAKDTLLQQCKNAINLFPKIANAGINPEVFKPAENKKQHQKKYFGKDVSITGVVMRNQKRKLFPDLFRGYRKYLDHLLATEQFELYDKSYLYCHTSYPENTGWDLPGLVLETGLANKVYFTYKCKNCNEVTHRKFQESASFCDKCNKVSVIMPSASNPIETEDLVKIYQTFDFFLQVAICEGFGMPQIEAASCGVPIASVDYSAMTEIVRNLEGYPIPVKKLWRELETGADRAYPDHIEISDILIDFFVNKTEEQRNNMSKRTRELCSKLYDWDDVANVWDEAFSSMDLSKNLDWDKPHPRPTNVSVRVPGNLPPTQFVDFIINEIINEPYLLATTPIINLKKAFGCGITAHGGNIIGMTQEFVSKNLEGFLNNKLSLIKLKEDKELLMKNCGDFLP